MLGNRIVHAHDCAQRIASECTIPIECEHGWDVCPLCSPCACDDPLPTLQRCAQCGIRAVKVVTNKTLPLCWPCIREWVAASMTELTRWLNQHVNAVPPGPTTPWQPPKEDAK